MDHAEIVVIGGGIAGTAAAVQLMRAGAGQVTLVERDQVGGGTTRAGAGFLDLWGATLPAWSQMIELESYSLAFYRDLASRKRDFGFRESGSLWVARDEDEWEVNIAPLLQHHATAGAEQVTGDEVAELTGLVVGNEVYAAAIQPSACRMSAQLAASALAEELVDLGGVLRAQERVVEVNVENGKVQGVTTDRRRLPADHVVVCAGAWTNSLLRPLSTWIPMVPLLASRFVSPPRGIQPDIPVILIPRNDIYIRENEGGLTWGCLYESAARWSLVDQEPPDSISQLGLDGVAEMARTGEELGRLVPLLRESKDWEYVTGTPCHTVDYLPVIGNVPGIDGLWVNSGDNYGGVTHAPAAGLLIAELITASVPTFDTSPFRVDRFDPGLRSAREIAKRPVVRGAGWAPPN